ncbi:metallophosphoesterase [Marinicella meishanensis]|uniref:metallophosphoesterase n=1 Tax=Marinicella meishanensis TaxID=2873263 RepID=UPI001CBE3450|nr:metallophosphoesterase [Marinicella sp. NBU2979]
MGRLILHNLKHFFITFFILLAVLIALGMAIGADAHLNQNPLAYHLDGEGPHVFQQDHQWTALTLRGNPDDGFHTEQQRHDLDQEFAAKVYFPLDDQHFTVTINPQILTPPVSYQDDQPMLAISDIEGGFKAFRDFLISHRVIDQELNWTFGSGHLVLVGDFVDRGNSVTQVLWLIYKLEQDAAEAGGRVHYIIGNHEIKNLQANFQAAEDKYHYIAAMLGKSQQQLYGEESFIGRWLASKNSIERINGVLFTHGGIHPEIADFKLDLTQVNQIIRDQYRKPHFTRRDPGQYDFITSSHTGPAWYRGYFKDDLSQAEVEQGLAAFGADAVVVGHTIQSEVSKLYGGKVYAIDVKHPKDYYFSFPLRRSEGLLIEGADFYRLLADGERQLL